MHTIHMRVVLDPLDFNADLSPTAENSVFYFSCMRAADLYLIFGRFDSTVCREGIMHDTDPRKVCMV